MRRLFRALSALLAVGLSLAATVALAGSPARVTAARLWAGPEGTRLVLDLSAPTRFAVFAIENPDRVVVDLSDARLDLSRGSLPPGQGAVKGLRSGPQADGSLRIVLDLEAARAPRSFLVPPDDNGGHRLVVELPPPGAAPSGPQVLGEAATTMRSVAQTVAPQVTPRATVTPEAVAPAPPPVRTVASTARGRDVVVAVDAGHGGEDPGAIGRGGTQEKHVTLAIARRLAKRIDAEPGMRAVLVRDGDHFIPLRGRIRKAREHDADMFVSVHADSVRDGSVSGSSVYVLSLRGASDEAARWLAERENAADLVGGVSLDDKDGVLASVLLDVTQEESLSGSIEAARRVLTALDKVGDVHRPTVQHAGFVVLKSPDIPSMLVETAFISNPRDERRLRDTDEQQRIAEAIHEGVRRYFYDHPPPGTKVAALSALQRAGGTTASSTLAER